MYVNFTTIPYCAWTGEYLVKIGCKSDWFWARSSDFPQNAKRVSCNLNLHITVTSYLRSLLCLTPPPFFWILITSISLGYTPPHAATRLRLYSVYKLCTTCSVNYIQCSQNQIGISQCDCKLVYWYFFIMGDYPVHVKTNCTQWLAAWLDLLLWVNVLWLDLDLQEMTCDFTLT